MKKLIVNNLYIFSVTEKLAKHITFAVGMNIITSNKDNGTKRGKSVILKSIFHTLGADCFFEDKWDENDKVFILDFEVDNVKYRILRQQRLFKIFLLEENEEIFRTVHRDELAIFLKSIFEFAVELPNKASGELELAPPAFNYMLNFTDQDHMDGSYFASFKSLSQYSDFKENVIYYHLNVYNAEYYQAKKEIEKKSKEQDLINNDSAINRNMLEKINQSINNNDYSSSIEHLQKEIDQSKNEYSAIITKLNKTKKTLISLRNKKEDMVSEINDLNLFSKDIEKEVKSLMKRECPICHKDIEDHIEERLGRYNTIEDILFLKAELESVINEVEYKINREEERYKQHLDQLAVYEDKIKINTREVSDILKYKGYIEVRETLIHDLGIAASELSDLENILKELKQKIKKFNAAKKTVNEQYYQWMLVDKRKFDLKEISDSKLEDLNYIIKAGGSNKPVATIIWYLNLLKLRNKYNPNAIKFPVVMDSPNNVETDEEKRINFLEHIFGFGEHVDQMIVSTLGFEKKDFPNIEFSNIIELTNEKYQLLNYEDYQSYKEVFISVMQGE